tara:strand:- start:459 stop:929 length:471 start_codon:yes stop_codon:yes gene_type:complete
METEKQILELIAVDRLDIPVSSLSGKLKRRKPKMAKAIDMEEYDGNFESDRVYARVETENRLKAKGIRAAVDEFSAQHPKYGAILEDMIADKREESETHLYFGMHEDRKLTSSDYVGVMRDLGFSEHQARRLYPQMMEFSHKLNRKRGEERSVLIG